MCFSPLTPHALLMTFSKRHDDISDGFLRLQRSHLFQIIPVHLTCVLDIFYDSLLFSLSSHIIVIRSWGSQQRLCVHVQEFKRFFRDLALHSHNRPQQRATYPDLNPQYEFNSKQTKDATFPQTLQTVHRFLQAGTLV